MTPTAAPKYRLVLLIPPPTPAKRRRHTGHGCGAELDRAGHCAACASTPAPDEIIMVPGPAVVAEHGRDDPASRTLRRPHRLLEPLLP